MRLGRWTAPSVGPGPAGCSCRQHSWASQAGSESPADMSRMGGEGGGAAVRLGCAGALEGSQRRKPSEVVSMRVPCGRMVGTSITMFSALPSS